jgi:hypothetical protein
MKRTHKLLQIVASSPFALIAITILYLWVEMQVKKLWPYEKPTGPVIGDLGGVLVAIPRSFARFVEYDADPHFMKKKRWSAPERTFESRLRSFGFEVRYPDMSSVEEKTPAEKDIHTTMWMRVGISTGEDYGVDTSLDNHKNYYINSDLPCFSKCFTYVPLPEKTFRLTGYTPIGSGVDVAKRSINFGRGTDMRDKNIYYFESESGHVTTFIECSNRTHAAAPCKHYFNLNPVMKAHIKVSYRKGLLPHWRQIQQSVTELIYSFEANPSSYSSTNQMKSMKRGRMKRHEKGTHLLFLSYRRKVCQGRREYWCQIVPTI